MKRVLFTVVAAALLSSCVLFPKKNFSGEVSGEEGVYHEPSQKAVNSLQLPPPSVAPENIIGVTDFPKKNIIEIAIGPIDLPSGSPHRRLPVRMTALPFDVWMHGFDWAITDESGRTLPPELLHHVNLIQPNERELFYPIARRLFAAGRETGSRALPGIYGVPVRADDPILVATMFAGPGETGYRNVTLHLWFHYSTAKERLINPKSVYPFYLDTQGPVGTKSFEVPPGTTKKTGEYSPAVNGRILGIGGHMHDYGEYLMLEDVTASKVLWKQEPEKTADGRVISVPSDTFIMPGRKKIYRDHTYRIVSVYNNTSDTKAADGGMGEIGGVFIPSGDDSWYEPDYHDPAYLEDMRLTLQLPLEPMHMEGMQGH